MPSIFQYMRLLGLGLVLGMQGCGGGGGDSGSSTPDPTDTPDPIEQPKVPMQKINVSQQKAQLVAGQDVNLTYSYSTAPAPVSLAGLVLRVHWSSQVLNDLTINTPFNEGLMGVGAVQEDTENFDGDANTDRYITLGWADYPAGAWPAQMGTSLALFTAQVNAKQSGQSSIRLSAQALANGYQFESQSVEVKVE